MAHDSRELALDELHAHLCRPRAGASAGLLLLPMIYGVDAAVRGYAGWLADAGFAAVIWDAYSSQPAPDDAVKGHSALAGSLLDEPSLAEQARWLGYMQAELGLQRLGVMGWCLGGRYGLMLAARDPRLAACVAYYPSIHRPPAANQPLDAVALAAGIPCPVEVIYPGLDDVTERDTFLALRQSLEARPAPTIVQLHPQAEHGFLDELRHPSQANAAAARLAWPQTMAFLHACLAS